MKDSGFLRNGSQLSRLTDKKIYCTLLMGDVSHTAAIEAATKNNEIFYKTCLQGNLYRMNTCHTVGSE